MLFDFYQQRTKETDQFNIMGSAANFTYDFAVAECACGMEVDYLPGVWAWGQIVGLWSKHVNAYIQSAKMSGASLVMGGLPRNSPPHTPAPHPCLTLLPHTAWADQVPRNLCVWDLHLRIWRALSCQAQTWLVASPETCTTLSAFLPPLP